jgi:A nuclease family of the HNH/ENDO VII superfamily with conserved AHH
VTSERRIIPFRAVNRRAAPGYRPGLQRHHLIPCEVLTRRCFSQVIAALGPEQSRLHDFRRNGLLLPANDVAAASLGLPLHRGPHRRYTELVFERFGRIEAEWSRTAPRCDRQALAEALARLDLLQSALRRRLLSVRPPLELNRRQQPRPNADFAALDAMAASLWAATE